jgi:hypothetical protein
MRQNLSIYSTGRYSEESQREMKSYDAAIAVKVLPLAIACPIVGIQKELSSLFQNKPLQGDLI